MSMKQKLSPLVTGALVGLIVIGLIRFGMSLGAPAQPRVVASPARAGSGRGAVAAQIQNGVQRAIISFSYEKANYDPSEIRLKRGVPAEITLSPDVPGCMGVLISRSLGIQIEAEVGKNVARFTPQEAGRFAFHCPMGMGRGTFIVE